LVDQLTPGLRGRALAARHGGLVSRGCSDMFIAAGPCGGMGWIEITGIIGIVDGKYKDNHFPCTIMTASSVEDG